MFTNILFLILALLMNALGPEEPSAGVIGDPVLAFLAGIGVWGVALALFALQKGRIQKSRATLIANCELLAALAVYHFFFVSQKIFYGFPEIVPSIFVAILWITGIGFFHACYGGIRAFKQQSLFLLPFALPFLFITALMDTFGFVEDWFVLTAISMAGLVALMIFLPALIQFIWRCTPLPKNELYHRFEALCKKARFKHAGIKTWTVMNDTHTAAIIGILPKYRYVMFTQRILDSFKPEWLEAVLAHEIGHSKNKHLLLYPFITFGMVLFAGLATSLVVEPFGNFFNGLNNSYPWVLWQELYTFSLFALFAAAIAIGFRLLFGYFSRLFERQADLYIFNLGVDAGCMADALNEIGCLTGFTHNKPNWHHHSIRQRIDFIRAASTNPALIADHNRKVRASLYIYFALLTLVTLGMLL